MDTHSLKPRFLTDENGARVAVVLTIAEYEAISDLLEDQADLAEIIRRRGERSIPHDTAMKLVEEGGAISD
ncbi:MAG: hypothetical protein GC168_04145 [Candidatus Hydrogenedens sp.]|nr:hypothetical protein [Candidatus Hydrogenedens sp.]